MLNNYSRTITNSKDTTALGLEGLVIGGVKRKTGNNDTYWDLNHIKDYYER